MWFSASLSSRICSSSVSRWLSSVLKLILTLGVLGAVVVAAEPSTLLTSLQNASWTWVVVAGLLLPVNLLLDGWVWKQLLAPVLPEVPLPRLAGAVLSGLALGFWTPARVGEYAGRAFFLPEGDRWTLSLTVFTQRMIDMAVGILIGLLVLTGALYWGLLPVTPAWQATAAVGGGIGGLLLLFITAPSLAYRLACRFFPNWTWLTERAAFFDELSGSTCAAALGGTIARYGVFTGQLACLGAAFAPSAHGLLLWGAASLTFYVKYLIPSLTVLDLGIREGGAAFFFQVLGLGAAAGLNAALLLFAINVLVPALFGVPFLTGLRLSTESPRSEPSVLTMPSGS